MRTAKLLPAALLVAVLTACSGSDDAGTSTPDPAPASTPSATSTPTASANTPVPSNPAPNTPASVTTQPKPAGPRAADGFNHQACRDATCEIYVKTGSRVPVRRSVAGFSTLVVSKVAATGVSFGGSTPNTSVSAGGQQPGFRSRLNNLAITTVAINPPLAILRLSPA